MILLDSVFASPILDAGDIINLLVVIGGAILWVFNYGKKIKDTESKLTNNATEIENLKIRLNGIKEDYESRIQFLDEHFNIEIHKNKEDIIDLKSVILDRLGEIEKKIIGENTYLKENVKYLTLLITRHEEKLGRLEDKIDERNKLDK